MDYNKAALEMHETHKGKVGIVSKVEVATRDDLSTAYTPGVAEPCRKIKENPDDVYKYTFKGNMVAVVSNGTAVLGLGDIGPEAGLPVMEGKAVLFKEFGGVDAFPICLDTQDTDEIVETVIRIAPAFGGINLEDIAAPRCFEIEARLNDALDIPQKCTGCAHLLDDVDSPIRVPRCVDNCHVDVILFGEEADLDLEGTEVLHPEYGTKPRVFYRGLPKKFIAATVYDPEAKEIVEDATVTAVSDEGTFTTTTNSWGDFCLDGLPEADWTLTVEKDGKTLVMNVSTRTKDQGLPDLALA